MKALVRGLSTCLLIACNTGAPIPAPPPIDTTSTEASVRAAVAGMPNADTVVENTMDYERRREATRRADAARSESIVKTLRGIEVDGATAESAGRVKEHVQLLAERLRNRFAADRDVASKDQSLATRISAIDNLEQATESKLAVLWRFAETLDASVTDPDRARATATAMRELVQGSDPPAPFLHSALSYVAPVFVPEQVARTSTVAPAVGDLSGILIGGPAGGLGADALQDDTRLAEEVVQTQTITSEAVRLGRSPARIYDFVKHNIVVDWSFGVRQDAEETLLNRRGTPWEIAALTIALLRAANVPARYVTATIRLGLPQARDIARAANGRELMALLAASGIPYSVETDPQTRVQTIIVEHVFVEAFMDYVPSRGVTPGAGLREWIPFDPCVSGKIRNTMTAPATSAAASVNPGAFLFSYRGSIASTDVVTAFAAATSAGQLRAFASSTEKLNYLPNSLPYKVVATTGEFAFLPDRLKPKATITLRSPSGQSLLHAEAPLHRLSGHRVSLTYVPHAAADEILLAESGGLANASLYLLQLHGELRIDGVSVPLLTDSLNRETIARVVSRSPIAAGAPIKISVGLASRTITNDAVAAMPITIDFGTGGSQRDVGRELSEGDTDNALLQKMADATHRYLRELGAAEASASPRFNLTYNYSESSIVFGRVEAKLDAPLGVPLSIKGSAVSIDAPLRPIALSAPGAREAVAFRRVLAEQGSFVEAKVLKDVFAVETTSATNLLQRAVGHTPVLTLTSASDPAFASLTHAQRVRNDILAQLQLGHEVVVPRDPMNVEDFTGTGYIVTNLQTGEAASILFGEVALGGGITIMRPSEWPSDLAAALADPIRVAPIAANRLRTTSSLRFTFLTDRMPVTRPGAPHDRDILVAITSDGRPVSGLPVEFSLTGQPAGGLYQTRSAAPVYTGGPKAAFVTAMATAPKTVEVTTNDLGYATAIFESAAFFSPFISVEASVCGNVGPQRVQAGYSQIAVSARVFGTTAFATDTLDIIACPLSAAEIVVQSDILVAAPTATVLATPVSFTARDVFDNPVANEGISISSDDPNARFGPESSSALLTSQLSTHVFLGTSASNGFVSARYGLGDLGEQNVRARLANAPSVRSQAIVVLGDLSRCALVLKRTPRPDALFSGGGLSGTLGAFAGYSVRGTLLSRGSSASAWSSQANVAMSLSVLDATSGVVLATTSGSTIVPRYLADGFNELRYTSASTPADCSSPPSASDFPFSSPPLVLLSRLRGAGEQRPIGSGDIVLSSDVGLIVSVAHAADTAQLLAVDDPDALFTLPDATTLPGYDKPHVILPPNQALQTSLLQARQFTQRNLPFALYPGARQGTVRFEFLSPPSPTSLGELAVHVATFSATLAADETVRRNGKGKVAESFIVDVRLDVPPEAVLGDLKLRVRPAGRPSSTLIPLARIPYQPVIVPAGTDIGTGPEFAISVVGQGANAQVESVDTLIPMNDTELDADGDGLSRTFDCDDEDRSVGLGGPDGLCDGPAKKCAGDLVAQRTSDDCCQAQGGPVRPLDGSMYYRPGSDVSRLTASGFAFSFGRSYETRIARGDNGKDSAVASIFGAGWRGSYESFVSLGKSLTGPQAAAPVNRITVHFDSGEDVTLQGPHHDTATGQRYFADVATNDKSSLYRAVWDGSDKLRVTMPDGLVYVYQGYVGAVVTAGAQLNLSQIIERDGTPIEITLDSLHRFISATRQDGMFYRRRDTDSGFVIEYGRATSVDGAVVYALTSLALPESFERQRVVTGVEWPDGQRETLSYTTADSLGVPFDLEAWSDGRGGRDLRDGGKTRDTPYALLSEVRDTFGNLVERHTYNALGVVTLTEVPGERLSFSYTPAPPNSTTTVTNTITGEVRSFTLRGPNLIAQSTSCASCSIQSEIRFDNLGRKIGILDKRGTWKGIEYEGKTNRVLRETDNGGPGSAAPIDPSAYRQVQNVFKGDFFSGAADSAETRIPSVAKPGSSVSIKKSYDPTSADNERPTALLRSLAATGEGSNGTETRKVDASYDSRGRITERRYTQGERETYVYYPDGTSFNGGRLKTIARACGPLPGGGGCELTTSFSEYNEWGRPERVEEADGTVHTYLYGLTGLLLAHTVASPQGPLTTSYVYDRGRLQSVTEADGSVLSYTYVAADADGQGQVASITRTGGASTERIELSYNAQSLPVEERTYKGGGALARITRRQYSIDGKLERELKFTDSAGSPAYSRDTFYNDAKDVIAIADENHASGYSLGAANVNLDYDALGRVRSVTTKVDASRTMTERYTYDAHDNVRTVTDGDGRVTRFDYDDFGQVTAVIAPDSGTTTFKYDTSGNLTERRDALGVRTAYAYDAIGRVRSISRTGGAESQTETYAYDSCHRGALCSVTDVSGTTSYAYDSLGRLLSETRAQSGTSLTTSYEYDGRGRLAAMVYPNGRRLTYRFAGDPGRISGIDVTVNGATTAVVANVEYDPLGVPTRYTLANGTVVEQSFNLSGELATLKSLPTINRTYQRDGVGNITTIVDPIRGSETFAYDKLHRLTSATGAAYGSLQLTYDLGGNRLTKATGAGTTNYALQAGTNKLNAIAGAEARSLAHNLRGDVTQSGTQAITYDAAQRVKEISTGGSAVGRYAYDFKFRRTSKEAGGEQRFFAFNAGDEIESELIACTTPPCDVGSLRTAVDYVYFGGMRVAAIAKSASGPSLVDEVRTLHNDHLGAPLAATRADQSTSWSTRRDPFGNRVAESGSAAVPFEFPGQYRDAETGLVQNWHRFYDPTTGRYLQADPITGSGDATYSYANSNPVGLTDPSGQIVPLAVAVGYGLMALKAAGIAAAAYELHKTAQNKCAGVDDKLWAVAMLAVAVVLPSGARGAAAVNIDTTAAVAFISEGSSARHAMKAALQGREMIMTETAAVELASNLRAAGSLEAARAQRFLSRVRIVADDPSLRAQGLRVTRNVGANDIKIFGTADRLQIPTMTNDTRFLRGASAQGVDFEHLLHPPVALRGL